MEQQQQGPQSSSSPRKTQKKKEARFPAHNALSCRCVAAAYSPNVATASLMSTAMRHDCRITLDDNDQIHQSTGHNYIWDNYKCQNWPRGAHMEQQLRMGEQGRAGDGTPRWPLLDELVVGRSGRPFECDDVQRVQAIGHATEFGARRHLHAQHGHDAAGRLAHETFVKRLAKLQLDSDPVRIKCRNASSGPNTVKISATTAMVVNPACSTFVTISVACRNSKSLAQSMTQSYSCGV